MPFPPCSLPGRPTDAPAALRPSALPTLLAKPPIGRYAIGLLDVAAGTVSRLPGFDGARHINPQWSPDGASLFFVADPGGISNVFRVELAGGPIAQVTDLYTGVSGITETSPALSVAQRAGRLVY